MTTTNAMPLLAARRGREDNAASAPATYPQDLERKPYAFGGVLSDYSRRFPLYLSDITDSFTPKTISAAVFMFLATFASTVALGVVISRNTACPVPSEAIVNGGNVTAAPCRGSYLGVTELLLMNSVAGMLHSLVGCQPLLVLRPTGPITAFLTLLFNVSQSMDLEFLPFLGWCGVFVGLYMILVAAFELSRFINLLTRFTHDIFAFFVCSIYIVDGVVGIMGRIDTAWKKVLPFDDHSISEAMFALILTGILIVVALSLHSMRSSSLFNRRFNSFLVDYALIIALVLVIFVSLIPRRQVFVETVAIPDAVGFSFRPSLSLPTGIVNGTVQYADRAWSTPLGYNQETILAAAIAAVPIVLFFFFDQNVSSLLCQKESMGLRKGSYFHSSFFCMGIFDLVAPAFGLPFVTGSLPHSPQLVAALTEESEASEFDELKDSKTSSSGRKVYENRIAPFVMYFLIGAALLVPEGRAVIKSVPTAAVDGILVFVGLAGLFDTQLYARLWLLFTEEARHPRDKLFTRVRKTSTMHLFTILPVTFFALAWVLNGLAMSDASLSPLGLCFPLVISFIVPFRIFVMPQFFDLEDIELLDAENEAQSASEEGMLLKSQDTSRGFSFGRTPQKEGEEGEGGEEGQRQEEEKSGDELFSMSA